MEQVINICFVCLGNVIRSPLAEHLFRHVAKEADRLAKYSVSSAGTDAWHVGESPDPRMRRVAATHGIQYDGTAQQLRPGDLEKYDLLFVMDQEILRDVVRMARSPEQRRKIHLLREYDPSSEPGAAVPDPYYGNIFDFEETYQIIERSVRGLFEALESGQVF